jgi:hypothetical protein
MLLRNLERRQPFRLHCSCIAELAEPNRNNSIYFHETIKGRAPWRKPWGWIIVTEPSASCDQHAAIAGGYIPAAPDDEFEPVFPTSH